MIVAFLPGFARGAGVFAGWPALLPGNDVRLCELPGQGVKPGMANATIGRMADHFAAEIPSGALLVGESLGGLIALAMAPRGYHVVAFEPLLSTAKQWPLAINIPLVVARNPNAVWLTSFVDALLGVGPGGAISERNAWPLLDTLDSPIDIVAGSEPLWPVRPVSVAPSVLDDVDAYHLRRHPMVRFHQFPGSHTVLSDQPERCRLLLLEILDGLADRAD